ncbi:MAG TPA: nuclear transport factor 2 family protein [Pyrinomonadaceae bacterium]|nr:nuclear transport factor 2 family protein [Pyrinomonadaceae bacterium]
MKHSSLFTLACSLTLVCVAVGSAALAGDREERAPKRVDRAAELQAVVRTERAFAKTSSEKGTRAAFLVFIADDGVLFRPGPVNGREFLTAQPERAGLLAWEPTYADVSRAGDMGVTTGPWEFRAKREDERAAAHGQFMTVWGKQTDGAWKFLIDTGISHDAPAHAPPSLSFASDFRQNTDRDKLDHDSVSLERNLLKLEREFSKASSDDAVKAFELYADTDARLLREGHFPATTRDAARKLLPPRTHSLTWEPTAARASRSGDLAYTYGTYELKTSSSIAERGHYTRVWKRKPDGRWRFLIDVLNPLPTK